MKLEIRDAVKEDIDRITEIEIEGFPPEEAASKEKYIWRQANYPDYMLVGLEDGAIQSAVCMIPNDKPLINDDIFEMEPIPEGRVCAVLSVMTAKSARGKGAAEAVLNAAIERAAEKGMESMSLTCKERLIHYYAKFGFEKIGVSESVHGGAVWYDMVKKL